MKSLLLVISFFYLSAFCSCGHVYDNTPFLYTGNCNKLPVGVESGAIIAPGGNTTSISVIESNVNK